MPDEIERSFASSSRALVVAPAGCGKTELIVRSVAVAGGQGRQLILTHTNAGVRALLDRFHGLGISSRSYRVETIDGWALKYVRAYPGLSGYHANGPSLEDLDWDSVRNAATRCLLKNAVQEVVKRSYSGIYVDEYQDCTVSQHSLVLMLAELLPCRIVGDPLQGIFDFAGAVDWDRDVRPHFPLLERLCTPWRWKNNKPLGTWLQGVRARIANGDEIDLSLAPIMHHEHEYRQAIATCKSLLKHSGESVVVMIGNYENQSRSFATNLKGQYIHMETVECGPLLEMAEKIDRLCGPALAVALIDFAGQCMSGVKSVLKSAHRRLSTGLLPKLSSRTKNGDVIDALIDVTRDGSPATILRALHLIEVLPDSALHSRELWSEMTKVLRWSGRNPGRSLVELARKTRESTRYMGRRVANRTVSRTILVKGLEFDHAVVLDASNKKIDAKSLYVAMTRGSKSLTILSDSTRIRKPKPTINPAYI